MLETPHTRTSSRSPLAARTAGNDYLVMERGRGGLLADASSAAAGYPYARRSPSSPRSPRGSQRPGSMGWPARTSSPRNPLRPGRNKQGRRIRTGQAGAAVQRLRAPPAERHSRHPMVNMSRSRRGEREIGFERNLRPGRSCLYEMRTGSPPEGDSHARGHRPVTSRGGGPPRLDREPRGGSPGCRDLTIMTGASRTRGPPGSYGGDSFPPRSIVCSRGARRTSFTDAGLPARWIAPPVGLARPSSARRSGGLWCGTREGSPESRGKRVGPPVPVERNQWAGALTEVKGRPEAAKDERSRSTDSGRRVPVRPGRSRFEPAS